MAQTLDLLKIAQDEQHGDLFKTLDGIYKRSAIKPTGCPDAIIWEGGSTAGGVKPVAHAFTDMFALNGTMMALDVLGLPFLGVPMMAQFRHDSKLASLEWFGKLDYIALKWSTAGAGTLGHLIGEDFKKRTNVNLLQVPYKGASPALTDVMGGQVDVYIGTLTSLIPLVKSGKLNAVAVTTAQRSVDFPEIPTLDENGAKGTDFSIWMGLFAPVGTPADIISTLNREVNRVLQSPDVVAKLKSVGVAPAGGSSQAFADFVKTDYAKWGDLVKASGIKLTD